MYDILYNTLLSIMMLITYLTKKLEIFTRIYEKKFFYI